MLFSFFITFIITVVVGLSIYNLYFIYKNKKLAKRFDKEFYDETKRLAESRLHHTRVNMLVEFMIWHNKMGLYETKQISGVKYLRGMNSAFREIWKNEK